MIRVTFPPHLRRFIELPDECQAGGDDVRSVLNELEDKFPGLAGYLLHENGSLRQHVNLFLDERLITDRTGLSDTTKGIQELVIMQALSGG